MAHYINSLDVTDEALKSLVNEDYLKRADTDLRNLARMRGVDVEDIETSPLDPILVDLCIAYLCKRICMDKAGINPQAYANGAEFDIYAYKLKVYSQRVKELEAMVTVELLTGDADTPEEFASGMELFRS